MGTITNKQIKTYANDYTNTLLTFFKKRIRNFQKRTGQVKETKEIPDYDKLVFGKDKETLAYTYAQCCNPIPGDPVFGFVTVGEGIKVHQKDCPNAIALNANYAYRIIDARWMDSTAEEYAANLILSGIDNLGLVNEVTQLISNTMHVNISKISFEASDGIFEGRISVSVKNKNILEKLVDRMKKLEGIEKVQRDLMR